MYFGRMASRQNIVYHVLYHYPCPDGVFAALAAHLYFTKTSKSAKFHPMKIFIPPEEQFQLEAVNSGDIVYTTDYTGNLDFLRKLCQRAEKVVVLDHHKTALEELNQRKEEGKLPPNILLHNNLEKSAATICWDYFRELTRRECNGEDILQDKSQIERVEKLMAYVEDGDLWKWKLSQSREFYAGFAAHNKLEMNPEKNPGLFDYLSQELEFEALIEIGAKALAQQDAIINSIVDKSFHLEIPNHGQFLGAFCGEHSNLRSQLGNKLAMKSQEQGLLPVGAVIYEIPGESGMEGVYKVSLRSVQGVPNNDTTKISLQFGGGGHLNASSFNVATAELEAWRRDQ